MSLSKKHKSYVSNGGSLSFAEWIVLYDRLADARKARGSAPKVRKAVKVAAVKAVTPKFERVANRVDCFAVKGANLSMAADVADITQIKRILGNTCKIGASYTSKRGERTRFTAPAASVAKLERKGFAVKGL